MRHRGSSSFGRLLVVIGVALGLALAGLAARPPAALAATLTVTSTADVAPTFGACGNPAQTTSGGSLREAVCAANNAGAAASTITVAAGTYLLTNGELQMGKVPGSTITLTGAGAASTIIQGNGTFRIFNLDPNLVGNVTTSISGVTITGGFDSTFGAGGIAAGSTAQPTGAPLDTLTVSNATITNNRASGGSNTGGGIAFAGGNLTITNSTISNNSTNGASGAGVWYRAEGTGPGEGLTITGTTFSGNTVSTGNAQVGGALEVQASRGSAAIFNVSNSRFVGNTVTGSGAGTPVGGAIHAPSGTLSVTESTFTGNSVAGGTNPAGGAVSVQGATVAMHYNRFTGNSAPSGSAVSVTAGSVDATDNWWGCNGGPGAAGCDTVAGGPTVSPRLVLTATAGPATMVGPNAAATITAALTTNSAGAAIGAANLDAFAGLPVAWSDPLPVGATLGAASTTISSGSASVTYNSRNTGGPGHVVAALDNGTATAALTVNRPPAITSANAASFTVGAAGAFTVTTSGYPAPAITRAGAVPPGMAFADNGNGTATLSGTPSAGGTYALNLTASNGVSPNAAQTLTVTVGQAPAFTSANRVTFTVGTAGTFAVTTSGSPPPAITRTGTLPAGLTFADNGNGTATLSGTPSPGAGGVYSLNLTAANGVSPNAAQAFTLTVTQAPAITSASATTFQVGVAGSFAVTTSAGFPAATALSKTGSLPAGVGFVDNGNGTATLAGTPAAGTAGSYPITITASNGASTPATQSFTLTVTASPVFTSADHITFVTGSAGSFTVTTSGGAGPVTITETGTLPSGVTFTDNGDGTATISGTPAAGTGGAYPLTFTASDGVTPNGTQLFTLTINQPPRITSTDHDTFTAGVAGSFTVTTAPGVPAATTLTATGALPSGVGFTDNGDGTATLAGTPAAGTAGSYPLTIAATNAAGPAQQSFTLTVDAAPGITSANAATFTAGAAGSFSVTAGGAPAPTLSASGALPGGVTFTDQGNGTATLSGTPAAGTGGTYALTITAANGVAPDATQSFTLTVNAAPTITSANSAAFTVGTAGSFSVTASGFPAPTFSATGTLPTGVTLSAGGLLSGTPAAGAAGTYPLTITAANGILPGATQAFTLTVDRAAQAPLAVTATPAGGRVGDRLALGTTGGSGGGAVTFDAGASTACALGTGADAGTLVLTRATGPGATCAVAATKAGDGAYNPATAPPLGVTVTRAAQTIAFPQPPAKSYGDAPFTVGATASSRLPVTFAAGPASVCTASGANGSTITLVGPGACTITASQPGDATYQPAADVSRSVGVAPCDGKFTDVAAGDPACAAVAALVSRGVIAGYATTPPRFGPDDQVQRAQVAAFLVRALGWQGRPQGPRTFADFDGLAGDLRAAALIAANACDARGVCVASGYGDGTFGPTKMVTKAEVIAFIARAFGLDSKYAWAAQPGAPNPYGGVPAVHETAVRTYTAYAGAIPDAPTTADGWNAPASRAWVARVLYQALMTKP